MRPLRVPLRYEPFNAGHLKYLTPQREQKYDHAVLLNSEYAAIVNDNFGLSAWVGNRCIGAAGCVPIFASRAVGWAILSNDAAPYMIPIVRKFRAIIDGLPHRRIEISVRADFFDGQRFAKLIGMKLETPEPMRCHGANGEDEYMYAVVK